MTTLGRALLLLVGIGSTSALLASDFVVVAATGVLEPEGLEVEQALPAGTVLSLEPWGRVAVRETAGCGHMHVIAGASEHALQPADDCSTVAGAMEVVGLIQQGASFAAPLAKGADADQLAAMLAAEPCVFLPRVSDEGANTRRCPSGYALRGLRCSGEHCDGKDLLCCPYLGGDADPDAKEIGSRLISEEFPNVVKSKQFLDGLACDGPFCDNIMPYQFKSPRLTQAKSCEWSAWSVDLPGQWLDCGDGKLMSGVRCRSDYCGNVAVYCCDAQAR